MPIVARILILDILQPFLDNVWAKQKDCTGSPLVSRKWEADRMREEDGGGKGGNDWWYLYVIMSGCVCTDMYALARGVGAGAPWKHRRWWSVAARRNAMEIRFGERTNNDKVMICRLFSVGLAQSVSIMGGKAEKLTSD